MRLLLACLLASQSLPAQEPSTAAFELGASTLTVTAPRDRPEVQALKAARATGGAAALGGAGYLAYMAAFGAAGPVGWAAALVFVGGMAAYLAHRRLSGAQDFPPEAPQPPPPPQRRRAV